MIRWLTHRVWPVTHETIGAWVEDDAMTLAAAVSYYAAFSLFPLLAVMLSALGMVMHFSPGELDSQQIVTEVIEQNTSRTLAQDVQPIIASVEQQAGIGGPIALVTLLIGAIGVFSQIDASFDRIWKVESAPSGGILTTLVRVLYYRLKAFLMLLALGALIVLSFAGGMVLTAVSKLARDWSGEWGGILLQHLVIVLINTCLFMLVYKTIPRVDVAWRDASRGGLFVAIVWEIGRQLLSLFVIGSKWGAYGLIGAFIAIMAWIYYASMVLFLGAELVHALGARRQRRQKALPT